jgi:hypothetical protein
MRTQWVFRGCSHSLISVHVHSLGVQGVFNTYSFAFTRTHKLSWGYSILTQRRSHALTSVQGVFSSGTNEIFLMVTPWWTAFNNDSIVFMHTQWVFRDCSHSLNGVHAHSMGVQGVFNIHSLAFTCTHKHSGGVQYVFSLFKYLKAQWICFQIYEACRGPINLLSVSIEFHFFGFAKQEDATSHLNTWLVGGLGVDQWDWQQKIRKYCKKLEN